MKKFTFMLVLLMVAGMLMGASHDYTIVDSPGRDDYYSNTLTELDWTTLNVEHDEIITDVEISYTWLTDIWQTEGSFSLKSPNGTTKILASGQSNGTYNLTVNDFAGESMEGIWELWIQDSYGDGGHQASNITIKFHYFQEGAPTPAHTPVPSNLAINVPINGDLVWTWGDDTSTYDLWFGLPGEMVKVVDGAIASGNTGSYIYANLENNTTYNWEVISYGNDMTISSSVWSFNTALPEGLIQIGNGTIDDLKLPINPYFGYNYSQTIYLQEELNVANSMITKIYYYWNGYQVGSNYKDWTVFIGHSEKTAFASTSDWEPMENLNQVFEGEVDIPATEGWIEIVLDTPFIYNNEDNIIVAVNETTPSYGYSSANFIGTSTSGVNRGLRVQRDSPSAYDINDLPATGTSVAGYANMRFQMQNIPDEPVAMINPQDKDFGIVISNTTARQTYTITNVGLQPLVVSDISISGDSEFSLENYENTTLGFLESLTFDLVYSPITSGNHSAVLSITDNTGRQTYNYDITGEGYDPTITADSHPENFDDIDDPYFLLGWGAYVDSISESALIGLSTTSPNSAPNNLRMYNSSDEDAVLIATSPIVENINNRRVRFFAKGEANYSLIVGTMSDQGDPETFIPLETIIMSNASYTEYVVYLEDATQGCIAFKHGLGGTYRSIDIDDVVIELIPDGLISSNQIPYVDGFEENNIHNSTNVNLWRQELVEETTKYWTVNETNTSFNRTPRTGDYNVTLHQGGEAWLFRPVELTSGVFYDIELFARQDGANPENANISLYYGNSPQISAMTNVLNAGVELVDGEYQRILARFPAPGTGTYYVGIKGVISAPENYLSIDDFGVSLTPTTPVYNVNPTEWAAGTHEVLTFVEQDFTVRNVGVGNLNIQNIQLSGNPSFTISVLPNMPQNISVEQELTFTVKYAPINASSHTATISILGANNAVHGTIPLTGTGFIPLAGTNFRYPHNFTLPVSDFQSNTELYDNIYDSSMIDPNSVYLNGYDFVSKFTLTEDSYLTGSVSGSWTGLFILNQEPNAESPAPVYGFAGSSSGGSINDLKLIAGTYYAVVSTWSSPDYSDFTLNLSATPATGEPLFAINPVDYNEEDDVYTHTFATTATGESNTTEFTVTNAGAGLFGIYSVFVEGDDSFTVTDLPLLPQNINFMNNSFVKFNVNYNPASAGTHTATLKIIEDQTRTVHEVELTGTANTVVSVTLLDEDFEVTPPADWTRMSGSLAEEPNLTDFEGVWTSYNHWSIGNFANNASHENGQGARVNLYGSSMNRWLVTPEIDLGNTPGDFVLNFDMALVGYSSTTPQLTGTDDKFAVIISPDNGQTWTSLNTLALWDNQGSERVLNNVSNTGEAVSLSLSNYTGTVKIAFYGESTVLNADNYLYVDNVKVAPVLPFVTSPGSVDFGTIAFGSESSTQNIAFLNNTDSEFNVTAITLVGTNANDFQLVNTPELPYALEAQGANFGSVGVKFNPAATGNKSANLRFTYSSGQTYNVPLTGQAINVSITEPVVEDFEGDVFPPLGWTITGDENNFNWRLMDSEPYAYSGNNSAMVGRDTGDYLLVSPVVNVANNNKTLSFFVRDHTYLETWDKDDEYLEVYISTSGSGINDFTGDPVVSLDSEDLMPLYRRVFVNLEDYVGQSVYVAFKRVATGGNYIYVDNVTFNSDVVPTYDAPTNVTAQLVDNYINVNWQAPVVLRSRFTRTGGYAIVLDSYNLYRNDILIASNLITTDYTDRNPLNGSLNTYTVRARYKEIVNEVETGVIVLSEHSNPFDIAFDVLFPPNSLTAINPDSTRNVILEWDNHSIGERWFTHQQGDTPQNSFGIANETYTAAHRFTPQQLGDLRGATLTKVKFVPGVAQDIYTIKVWVGGSSGPYNPGFLVSEQQVTGVIANQWNEVTLDTPVNIPQNRELWIGYEVTQPGLATARCDAGPRQHGSGNLLKRSSQDNWTTMFNYQPIHSYNWLIQGLAEAPGDEYITFSSSGNRRVSREEFVSDIRSLTGYKVYRGEELLETISANTYTDTNVPDGEHTYYVSAVYDGGESEATPVNVIVEVADAFPATGLTATSDYGRVELMWEAPVPEFNTGRELAGYNIYKQERDVPARSSLRRSDEYAGFEFLVQIEANVTSYVDNDNREREFAYYVTAVYDNPEGESIPSNISAAVPLGYNAPQNIVAETAFDNTTGTYTVDLVWDAPEFDDRLVVNYNIYRNQDLLNETPIADLNFTDEGVVFGNYTYYVTAVYEDYDNAESFPVEVELILDNIIPPVNLTYLVDYYTITLNWQAHSSRAMLSSKRSSRDANNFIGYNVYRNDELLTETPITALTFVEEDMAPDTYIYKITSVYDYTGGESLPIVIEIEVDDIQAVQNLTAEVDDYDVILAWEYPEGYDSFNGLLGFNLYRNEELVNEEALLNVLTYTHDNILNGTYVYSVVAVYRNGEAEAVTVDVTVDYEHIMPPRDLACEQYQDDVILSWIAPGNPAGLRAQLGYNIYRDEVLITEEPVADLTYTDENLVNGEYTYSVSAVYESGESETESVSLNLFYLPEPEDLNVEIPENENTVILTWTAPPAHLEFGDVTGFDIWRKYFGRSRVSWVKINEEPLPVSQLTYTDPEILDGDYLYAVTARYENYDNDEAEPIIFTTVEVNMHFVYVQVPTNVTQTVEQNNVTLYWLPYAGNEEIGSLLGYKIYRNDELLNEDLLNASTFTDSDVPWGTYIYGVRAVYGIYESNIVYLPEIEITYEPTPPAVNLTAMVDDNEVTLNWQAPEHLQNDRAFVGYKVYRNEELLTEELIAETTYLDEEVDYGVHTYAVQAVYNGGESSLLSISVIVDNIQPIVNLDAVVTNYDVTLNWDVPEHLQENRALLNYQIYRGEILLAETTEQEFTDIEVEPGIYTYGVIAVYDNGPAEIVTVETTVYDLVPATNLAYELTEYTLALSWDRAESEFVEAYHIYKNDELLVELTIEDSLYTDTVVEAGIYTYAIKAIYPTGGVLSEAISVEVDYINIVTQLNAIVTNYDVTLNWLAPGNEIRALLGYNIMKDDVLLNEELITENTFTDTELEPGGYIYAVSAVFANGESDYVTLEVIVDDMLPVINLSAVAYEYNVYLNWEINESSAAQGYKIFRDGVSVSDDIIEELNFTDTNVSVGIHEYAVNAVYSNGMSEAVTYEVEIVPHIISIFPYTYGFENDNFPGVDWINTHIGDANGSWRERNNSEYANTGNKSAMVGNTRGDYWLISPPVEVTEDSKTLSFFARDHSNTTTMDKADEYLYVKISTSSQSLIGFETVATLDYRSLQTQYQKYVVDLSDYMNQTIHIAFNRLSTGGNYVYLDDVSFDAQELPVFNAPQNVIAQAGENEITIEWELPTIEEGQQLVAYKLFRNNNLISELNELSYLDNNVVADTEYQYFVKAVYTQGISLASEIATATPYQLLPATQLTAVPGDMQIALTWQAPVMNISRNTISSARSNRDNVLILEGYQVYRNNVAITETVSDADFVDTNVMPGVTYRYYVKAVYNLGVSSASNTIQTVAYQIIAPHTLTATEGLNRITLNWQHGISLVRNNKNELKSNQGQMKFNVYKDGEILASSITSRFYQDNAVVAGEEHTYYVTAVYRQGESQASESVTAEAYDLQAPRELMANAGNRQVELVWTAPTYMNDDFFVGYKVYRNGVVIVENITDLTYTDLNLQANIVYNYRVSAVYVQGESEQTDPVMVRPYQFLAPRNLQARSGVNRISLTWSAPVSGLTSNTGNRPVGYIVYRNETAITETMTNLSYVDNDINVDTEYQYYVTAIYENPDGESNPSNIVTAIGYAPVFAAPVNITADYDNSQIVINWEAPITEKDPGYDTEILSGYRVYRDEEIIADNLTDLSFIDSNIRINESYTYAITAIYTDPDGESEINDTVTINFVSINDDPMMPLTTNLNNNYPNPFNPETTISFSLAKEDFVTIEIYNVKGSLVKTLVNGHLNAGNHNILWTGKDESNRSVASGMYFYRMKSGHYTATRKMIMIK